MQPNKGTGGETVHPGHTEIGRSASAAFPPPRSAEDFGESAVSPSREPGTLRSWSPWSVATLTLTAALLAGALLVHLAMVFLSLTPPNALKAGERPTAHSYIEREFGQQWQLFAPDPKQRNDAIGVRMQTVGNGGTRHVSDWINLTAEDVAEIKGNPAPSHVTQNMLRMAWDNSEAWYGPDNRAKGARGKIAVDYLKRTVLQRVGRQSHGERVTRVQIAGRYTLVQPPSWSSEKASDTTYYRVLPWWPVTDKDYRGL